MTRKLLAIALLSAMTLSSNLQAGQNPDSPLQLSLVRGGAVRGEPVVDGRYVHFPTGRVLATWDYAKPTAPLRVASTKPADGAINSVARRGNYLYASWRGHDGTSGVATYSLADPSKPVLVGQSQDYFDAEKFALGLVVANDHLYLFDNNHGVFVSDLSDPAKPAFVRSAIEGTPVQYSTFVAHGDQIKATGRSWIGGTVLDIYDVSKPDAPVQMASHLVDGLDSFSLTLEPDLAIGIGNQLSLFDLSNPTQMLKRSYLDVPPATRGVRVDGHYYSYGWGEGMDIWNIANIDAPNAVGHLDLSALAGHHAVKLGKTMLLQTDTDLVHSLDVGTPAQPRRLATAWLPAGVDARDMAMHRGRAVLLQPNYGLMLSDSKTLSPLSRFEANLPQSLPGRSLEQVTVVGDRAYIAAWGFGLINVDLSNPKQPVELGQFEFPFAAVLDVKDHYAYVAKWTNGGLFAAIDVSNPAKPQLAWQGGLSSQPYRLKIDKQHAFLAEGREYGLDTGGLRVFDLGNPAEPVETAHINQDCGNAFDIAIDSAMSLAYLACETGLQVIDIAQPESPVVVGQYTTGGAEQYNKVAQRGDRVWYADSNGLHELDVSDPTHPVLLKRTDLGHQAPQRLFVSGDGRLFVLGGETGVHIFARSKGK